MLMSLDGDQFELIDTYELQNIDGFQMFEFAETKTMRFLKIVVKCSWDGEKFAGIAEINLYRNRSGRVHPISGYAHHKIRINGCTHNARAPVLQEVSSKNSYSASKFPTKTSKTKRSPS